MLCSLHHIDGGDEQQGLFSEVGIKDKGRRIRGKQVMTFFFILYPLDLFRGSWSPFPSTSDHSSNRPHDDNHLRITKVMLRYAAHKKANDTQKSPQDETAQRLILRREALIGFPPQT